MQASALPKPESRLGALALYISLGVWAVILWWRYGPMPEWLDALEEVFWLAAIPGALLVALVLGTVGLVQRGRNKKLAVLALVVLFGPDLFTALSLYRHGTDADAMMRCI